MKLKKALIRGTIGVAAGLPLAFQLMTPTAASAMVWGPQIIAASLTSGPASGGTTVTITGKGLTVVSGVLFGNVPASYTIVSNTEIIAISPAEPAGTVVVHIQDGPRPGFGGVNFTYS